MNLRILQSLRARLIVGAAIGIAIGLSVAGIFIAQLFRQYALQLVDSELREHLAELVGLIEIGPDGVPHLHRPLSDPQFNEAGSGYSWQISRSGQNLLRSGSIDADDMAVSGDALDSDQIRKLTLNGQRGPIIAYERMFQPGGTSTPPLRVQIGTDPAIIDRLLPTFTTPLAISLGLLAVILMAAAALQVAFGLQPMSRLRHALNEIKSGKLAKLPSSFPSEVQPLVDDLNALIEINSQMVMRARAQAGNLAHALKTPLAVLTDEAYRLESRQQVKSAGVILQQSHRMQRQIDYQLARARAATSRSLPGVAAPVGTAAAGIVSAMRRLYAQRNLEMVETVDARCIARCDPMDLSEMLANLIDNACKWAARSVVVRGVVQNDASQVVITVEDDGAGLPPESLEVVFGIGERLDEQIPGSGLGLPIVRDLAQLYGGSIHLEGSPMGGLRAVLRLPLTA